MRREDFEGDEAKAEFYAFVFFMAALFGTAGFVLGYAVRHWFG